MRQLLTTIAACAAGLALGTQAQTSQTPGGSSADPATTTPGSQSPGAYGTPSSQTPSSQSGWSGRHLSATGRMGHEPVRSSQLTGAPVSSTSGSEVGVISDTIINPASGRLEFAVIALSGNAGTATSSSSPSSTSSTGVGTSTSGKQVAVPWALLRPSMTGSSSSAAGTSANAQQPSFAFAGDISKLQSAPNFDASTDLTQPSWRQSVFSYFGLSGASPATGGAESPGGSNSGSTTPQSSDGK